MNTITISKTTSSFTTRMHAQFKKQTAYMTSLEIAEICGKPHNDILKAIRKMEPAWERVSLGKFSQSSRKVLFINAKKIEPKVFLLSAFFVSLQA